MKYEEIIKLLDGGYSREEILEMDKPAPEPDPAPAPEPDPAPTDTPDPAPDMAGMMSEMKTMFADLTKELVASNIMRSRIDGEDDNEDIIAKIINPKIDKNGGK
mgnify:CR=1 FL=1